MLVGQISKLFVSNVDYNKLLTRNNAKQVDDCVAVVATQFSRSKLYPAHIHVNACM